ncbi:MAG: hypothetical protein KUG82_11205 [Pseudomonadales bacterium]|nr:hypothetical protein [Pseudomonadales bacterium]
METSLIIQLVTLAIVVLLITAVINIKTIVANGKVRKSLGGAVIVVSSVFGGTRHTPKQEPESEKSGEPK